MLRFFSFITGKDVITNDHLTPGLESLDSIRNKIIDSINIAGAIISTFALYGLIMRSIFSGWEWFYFFQVFIFFITWFVVIFRKLVTLRWKSIIFFCILFIANTILNFTDGIVSGSMQFIIVTTLITLLFGWRLGVFTIILTLIVRAAIAWCFYSGILVYQIDLNSYAISLNAIITSIVGWIFTSTIIVFSINKFYQWLQVSLLKLSDKAEELSESNKQLLIAKQKAEENDKLKSVFLANMSHEIRTPMNAIIGFSDLLSKKNLSEERRLRYINLIQVRSYDLLRIIQDILDISKIEVGQMELIESDIQIGSFLNEIFEYYKLKAEHSTDKNELEINYYLPDDLADLTISVDSQRLKQVLNNLLDNAYKFTHRGSIEFGCERHTNNELMFYVKDSGIGICKDKHDIVFERFGQADNSLGSRQYGGTGLGLSIVRGILDLMGGEVWFNSELYKGTSFYFTIPLIYGSLNQKSINTKKNKVETRNWHKKNVLIVEDDVANNEFLYDLLSEQGLKVIKAFSGKETLSVLLTNPNIDLVLLDVRLPDINGLELTKKIKKERPYTIIIAQTAYAGNESVDECMKAGCDNYIAKPIKADQLLSLMELYLKK